MPYLCYTELRSETSPDHTRVSFYLCLRPTYNEDRMTPQRGWAMFLNAALCISCAIALTRRVTEACDWLKCT